jgi:S-adenosylmethionine:tRNA ribosyltransferase-isomerase
VVFSPHSGLSTLDFQLPADLEAGEPPEARGLTRDQVRLMVSYYGDSQQSNRYRDHDGVIHSRFRDIARFLEAGDVLVINTSGTMNAAIPASRDDGMPLELHLSTRLPADLWSVEVRRPSGNSTVPFFEARAGEALQLSEGGRVILHTPYSREQRSLTSDRVRLWIATLQLPMPLGDYLARHGFPIRYSYVNERWPLSYYQSVYATEIGSAEMPSAGRAFTADLITQLVAKGVQIAPLILHTGVASLEDHEPPYDEFYRVPVVTADLVNRARLAGKRVIAVGTTVIRALETATDEAGRTHPSEGWTNVVVTPQRGIRSVVGLLTGLHEPRATHLAMLEALAGLDHLCLAYTEALEQQYLWHEFGDLHLLLP